MMVELTIETCMRAGQSIFIAIVTMNVELAESIHAFELFETIQRDLASTRDELEKFGTFFLIK